MAKPEELDPKSQEAVGDILKTQQGENDNVTEIRGKEEEPKRLMGKDFDSKMVDMLVQGRKDLDDIVIQRAALTAKKNEVIARYSAKGLSPDAIVAAAKYCEKSDDAKRNYDVSYAFAREVFGEPVQVDLFEESLAAEIRQKMAAAN